MMAVSNDGCNKLWWKHDSDSRNNNDVTKSEVQGISIPKAKEDILWYGRQYEGQGHQLHGHAKDFHAIMTSSPSPLVLRDVGRGTGHVVLVIVEAW